MTPLHDKIDSKGQSWSSPYGQGAVSAPNTLCDVQTTSLSKPDHPQHEIESSFPEGGLRAWLTVLGASFVLFCTFGMVQSYGAFQQYYTQETLSNTSTSAVSWIGSAQVFLLFFVALPVGKLYDMGYFHYLIGFGSLLYLLAIFMLSLATPHHYYQFFFSQGIAMGLAMGILFLPALSITSQYFSVRRSISMGIVFAGSSLGGVLWPIMVNNLFDIKSTGFPWAVRTAAFVALALLLVANLVMRPRVASLGEKSPVKAPPFSTLLTDRPYWVSLIGAFFVYWGLFFPIFYLQLFSILHGVPRHNAIYANPMLNAGSAIGRTILGYVADKWGRFNVLIPCTAVCGGLVFAMFGIKDTVGMTLFAVLYGVFSGTFISLIGPTWTLFAISVNEVGIRIGFGMFVTSFALLIGDPISGALLKQPLYKWERPIIFNGALVLVGCALLLVSRQMAVRKMGAREGWII